MDDKIKAGEFLEKCEYEGGLLGGLAYGLTWRNLDTDDEELVTLVRTVGAAIDSVQHLLDEYQEKLDQYDVCV